MRFRAGVRASLTVCVSAFLPSLLQSRRPEPRLRTPAQDKRITVLKLFHESAEPWLLKDMEKAAAKKGVVFQAVKDVVQSLVDDSLVHMDKVGTSNWFWSFPGAADAAVRARLEAVEREATRVDAESRDIAQRVQTAQAECPETEDRVSARDALERAEATHASLKAEAATFASGDDAVRAAMREGPPGGGRMPPDGVLGTDGWLDGVPDGAALGGGGGAMASSSSRSLPAASSSALLSASFPGPGLWRRRRTLVGCDVVVGLACQKLSVCVGDLPRCKFCCKLNICCVILAVLLQQGVYKSAAWCCAKKLAPSVLVPLGPH